MSRRHTNRTIEQPPAQADLGDRTIDHFENAGIPIWYATRMPYPWGAYYWHQWGSAWAQLSLDVCERVWRAQGIKLYAIQRDHALRDDLHDWLIVTGVEAMADFTPRPWHPAPEKNWAAYLHRFLTKRARWHFQQVIGNRRKAGGMAAINAHNAGIVSTDHLTEIEDEGGPAIQRHALHGTPFESRDPAAVLIHLEELNHQATTIERDQRQAGTYSTSSTQVGQPCLTLGCDRASISRGLCATHNAAGYRSRLPTCSAHDCTSRAQNQRTGLCKRHLNEATAAGEVEQYTTPDHCQEDGCEETKIEAKGRCRRHYEAWRRTATTGDPCTAEGCDRTTNTGGRGMCATHYNRWRREQAPPCTIDGCDRRVKARDMCSPHYRRWIAARDAGEGQEYPT